MSKMCSMNGCQSCGGVCKHEKLMAMMGILGLLGALGHWGLAWF